MPESNETAVEVRCPSDLRRLFTKLKSEGKKPLMVEGNLMEFACSDCARELRKSGRDVKRVLHRFSFLGDLVESVIEERDVTR